MEYRQHQLANGLQILAECNDQAYMSAFGFFVRTGARDEPVEISGVSHFLEHMAFKGTPNRTAEQVNRELDDMGSSSNARTSEESTVYHSAVLPEFQSQMIELLSDIMRPSLEAEEFETEKQVIIEEIKMYQDQPPYGGHERIMQEFFGTHPLGQSVLGTEETITALTPDQMKDYFQTRYCPSNIALVGAGKVDFERLVGDAESLCGDWNSFGARRVKQRAQARSGFGELYNANSAQQYIIQLSEAPAAEDQDRYAGRVLATVLGDDAGSRMYWKFVDPGLAESAGMGAYEYQASGLMMSYLCCAPSEAQQNIQRLQDMQLEAQEKGVTEKELKMAKRKIASHIVLASERTESRMFSVGAQWLIGQKFKTVAEIAADYEAVTLDQVNQVLAKYPLTTNMTLVVGPERNLKPCTG